MFNTKLALASTSLFINTVLIIFGNVIYGLTQHFDSIVYLTQLLIGASLILRKYKYIYQLFRPSVILFLYSSFSFALGSYFIKINLGFMTHDYINEYSQVVDYLQIFNYLSISLSIVLFISLMGSVSHLGSGGSRKLISKKKIKSSDIIFVSLYFIVIYSIEHISSTLSFGVHVACVVLILQRLYHANFIFRGIIYVLILISIASISFNNKREILMIMMLIMVYEVHRSKFQLKNVSTVLPLFMGALLSFVIFILSSSILRGYGGFEVVSLADALLYIPEYISSPIFLSSLVDNFELSHTYPSAVLAIDYVNKGFIDVQYGLTLIKPIFLIVPRDIGLYKPDSLMLLFTEIHSPMQYLQGASLPVSFLSELYANFLWGGLLITAPIVFLMDYPFRLLEKYGGNLVYKSLIIPAIPTAFIYIRGGGFDLYFLTLCSSIPILIFIYIVRNHLRQRATNK